MDSVVFPLEFFDLHEVHDLPPEQKLLLGASSIHPRVSAAGVVSLTPFFASAVCLPHETVIGLAIDLDRRGVATFDCETLEFFVNMTFATWKAPTQMAAGSGWANAVYAALSQTRSERVCSAIDKSIACAPDKKLAGVLVGANALTSIPRRNGGGRWSASELLTYLISLANPLQTRAGAFTVDLDALGALASLASATVGECLLSLDASGALVYDADTQEIFVSAVLRCAQARYVNDIKQTVDNLLSRHVRSAVRAEAKRRFPHAFAVKTRTSRKNIEESDSNGLVDLEFSLSEQSSGLGNDFSMLRAALGQLNKFAEIRNKKSITSADTDCLNEAIAYARKHKLSDAAAAKAIKKLEGKRGWPREAVAALEKMRAEIAEEKHQKIIRSS